MDKQFIDLHIHSYFSDGTMSPMEILNSANKNNVSILSITDHNIIDGSKQLFKSESTNDLKLISGVEIDAFENGQKFHILCYGFDLNDKMFNDFINANRYLLGTLDKELIIRMENENYSVSISEFNDYEYDHSLGGWKLLRYLMQKNIIAKIEDVFAIYKKYSFLKENVPLPTIKDTCSNIHSANGKAVLAHPGESMIHKDIDVFTKNIEKIITYEIDGIECYHPSNSYDLVKKCIEICKNNKMLITSGSDSHGSFNNRNIGQMKTTIDMVDIQDL